jgi:hypothetical protein
MLNIRMSRTPIEGSPLTEEFETQEVREQSRLHICQVLHVGLKPQHAAPQKWCQDKSKDWGMLANQFIQ